MFLVLNLNLPEQNDLVAHTHVPMQLSISWHMPAGSFNFLKFIRIPGIVLLPHEPVVRLWHWRVLNTIFFDIYYFTKQKDDQNLNPMLPISFCDPSLYIRKEV